MKFVKNGSAHIITTMAILYEYLPELVDSETSIRIYGELSTTVKNLPQQEVVVYGKIYSQPRIVGYFSKNDTLYTYSGALQINSG